MGDGLSTLGDTLSNSPNLLDPLLEPEGAAFTKARRVESYTNVCPSIIFLIKNVGTYALIREFIPTIIE